MANQAFCIPCAHDHISGIPTSTWACHQCGFGSWLKITAAEHIKHCPDHQVHEVQHRFLDEAALAALIREKQAEVLEAAADMIHDEHVNGHAREALGSPEPWAAHARMRSEAAGSIESHLRSTATELRNGGNTEGSDT